jgi:rhodanese-related sulfurtransferase
MPPSTSEEILQRAAERGEAAGLDYAGAVTPEEAWQLMQAADAQLIDVRSPAELKWVGRVPGGRPIEWIGADPANPQRFVGALRTLAQPEQIVLMLCRSGARSHAAASAAAAAGYRRAFNILEGFEGKLDGQKHRGTLEGWRFRSLPWEQE